MDRMDGQPSAGILNKQVRETDRLYSVTTTFFEKYIASSRKGKINLIDLDKTIIY